MASPSKRTDIIRKRKKSKVGNKRKAENQNKGTTPTAAKLFGDEK